MLSRQRGTVRRFRLAGRRRRRRGAASEAGMRWSARYRGIQSWRHRYTIRPSAVSCTGKSNFDVDNVRLRLLVWSEGMIVVRFRSRMNHITGSSDFELVLRVQIIYQILMYRYVLSMPYCLPYNLYCVGGDVKHCTIQSMPLIMLWWICWVLSSDINI